MFSIESPIEAAERLRRIADGLTDPNDAQVVLDYVEQLVSTTADDSDPQEKTAA